MSSDQTKAQFAEAKAFIQQKRYADARRILKSINHPTAREWEKKLDAIVPQPKSNKFVRRLLIAVAVLWVAIVLIFGAYLVVKNPGNCDSLGWWKTVQGSVTHFLDSAETASKTPRMSVGTLILDMRQAQRDYEALTYPDCVKNIQSNVSRGMDNAISGFEDFAGGSDGDFSFSTANQYFYNADVQLGLLGDHRMYNTGVFIWGGDNPTDAKATEGAKPIDVTAVIATNDAVMNILHATETAAAQSP